MAVSIHLFVLTTVTAITKEREKDDDWISIYWRFQRHALSSVSKNFLILFCDFFLYCVQVYICTYEAGVCVSVYLNIENGKRIDVIILIIICRIFLVVVVGARIYFEFFFTPACFFWQGLDFFRLYTHRYLFKFCWKGRGKKKKGSGVVGVDRLRRSPVDAVIDLCRDVKEKGTHTHTDRR